MAQIKDEKQYKAVMIRIDQLFSETDENTPGDDSRFQELELLSVLVEEYEIEHYPIETTPLTSLKKVSLTSLEGLITEDFGPIGSLRRDQFEMECDAFIIGEQLKEERLRAGLTQEQLADRIGTKKSFISRVEKGRADIQLSTLVKLFRGLGRQICVRVL